MDRKLRRGDYIDLSCDDEGISKNEITTRNGGEDNQIQKKPFIEFPPIELLSSDDDEENPKKTSNNNIKNTTQSSKSVNKPNAALVTYSLSDEDENSISAHSKNSKINEQRAHHSTSKNSQTIDRRDNFNEHFNSTQNNCYSKNTSDRRQINDNSTDYDYSDVNQPQSINNSGDNHNRHFKNQSYRLPGELIQNHRRNSRSYEQNSSVGVTSKYSSNNHYNNQEVPPTCPLGPADQYGHTTTGYQPPLTPIHFPRHLPPPPHGHNTGFVPDDRPRRPSRENLGTSSNPSSSFNPSVSPELYQRNTDSQWRYNTKHFPPNYRDDYHHNQRERKGGYKRDRHQNQSYNNRPPQHQYQQFSMSRPPPSFRPDIPPPNNFIPYPPPPPPQTSYPLNNNPQVQQLPSYSNTNTTVQNPPNLLSPKEPKPSVSPLERRSSVDNSTKEPLSVSKIDRTDKTSNKKQTNGTNISTSIPREPPPIQETTSSNIIPERLSNNSKDSNTEKSCCNHENMSSGYSSSHDRSSSVESMKKPDFSSQNSTASNISYLQHNKTSALVKTNIITLSESKMSDHFHDSVMVRNLPDIIKMEERVNPKKTKLQQHIQNQNKPPREGSDSIPVLDELSLINDFVRPLINDFQRIEQQPVSDDDIQSLMYITPESAPIVVRQTQESNLVGRKRTHDDNLAEPQRKRSKNAETDNSFSNSYNRNNSRMVEDGRSQSCSREEGDVRLHNNGGRPEESDEEGPDECEAFKNQLSVIMPGDHLRTRICSIDTMKDYHNSNNSREICDRFNTNCSRLNNLKLNSTDNSQTTSKSLLINFPETLSNNSQNRVESTNDNTITSSSSSNDDDRTIFNGRLLVKRKKKSFKKEYAFDEAVLLARYIRKLEDTSEAPDSDYEEQDNYEYDNREGFQLLSDTFCTKALKDFKVSLDHPDSDNESGDHQHRRFTLPIISNKQNRKMKPKSLFEKVLGENWCNQLYARAEDPHYIFDEKEDVEADPEITSLSRDRTINTPIDISCPERDRVLNWHLDVVPQILSWEVTYLEDLVELMWEYLKDLGNHYQFCRYQSNFRDVILQHMYYFYMYYTTLDTSQSSNRDYYDAMEYMCTLYVDMELRRIDEIKSLAKDSSNIEKAAEISQRIKNVLNTFMRREQSRIYHILLLAYHEIDFTVAKPVVKAVLSTVIEYFLINTNDNDENSYTKIDFIQCFILIEKLKMVRRAQYHKELDKWLRLKFRRFFPIKKYSDIEQVLTLPGSTDVERVRNRRRGVSMLVKKYFRYFKNVSENPKVTNKMLEDERMTSDCARRLVDPDWQYISTYYKFKSELRTWQDDHPEDIKIDINQLENGKELGVQFEEEPQPSSNNIFDEIKTEYIDDDGFCNNNDAVIGDRIPITSLTEPSQIEQFSKYMTEFIGNLELKESTLPLSSIDTTGNDLLSGGDGRITNEKLSALQENPATELSETLCISNSVESLLNTMLPDSIRTHVRRTLPPKQSLSPAPSSICDGTSQNLIDDNQGLSPVNVPSPSPKSESSSEESSFSMIDNGRDRINNNVRSRLDNIELPVPISPIRTVTTPTSPIRMNNKNNKEKETVSVATSPIRISTATSPIEIVPTICDDTTELLPSNPETVQTVENDIPLLNDTPVVEVTSNVPSDILLESETVEKTPVEQEVSTTEKSDLEREQELLEESEASDVEEMIDSDREDELLLDVGDSQDRTIPQSIESIENVETQPTTSIEPIQETVEIIPSQEQSINKDYLYNMLTPPSETPSDEQNTKLNEKCVYAEISDIRTEESQDKEIINDNTTSKTRHLQTEEYFDGFRIPSPANYNGEDMEISDNELIENETTVLKDRSNVENKQDKDISTQEPKNGNLLKPGPLSKKLINKNSNPQTTSCSSTTTTSLEQFTQFEQSFNWNHFNNDLSPNENRQSSPVDDNRSLRIVNDNSCSNSPNDMLSPAFEIIDDFQMQEFFDESPPNEGGNNGLLKVPSNNVIKSPPPGILKKDSSAKSQQKATKFLRFAPLPPPILKRKDISEGDDDNSSHTEKRIKIIVPHYDDKLFTPVVRLQRFAFLERLVKNAIQVSRGTVRVDFDKTTPYINEKDVVRSASPPKISCLVSLNMFPSPSPSSSEVPPVLNNLERNRKKPVTGNNGLNHRIDIPRKRDFRAPSQEEATTTPNVDNVEVVVKRKRGRPPKNPSKNKTNSDGKNVMNKPEINIDELLKSGAYFDKPFRPDFS